MDIKKSGKYNSFLGWSGLSVFIILSGFWGFWGIIENFHEGWYNTSVIENLLMMFFQYLAPFFVFLTFGILSIYFRKITSIISICIGIAILYYFNFSNISIFFIAGPILVLALIIWFGEIRRKKPALILALSIPIMVIIGFGIEPAIRVAGRIHDDYSGTRVLTINDKTLVFAPDGPGWSKTGCNWKTADSLCRYLAFDGKSIESSPQNIWRLPGLEELVMFSHRHGKPANGKIDRKSFTAGYDVMPDKEPPLWNQHSQIIYWWVSDRPDSINSYKFVYNGQFYKTPIKVKWGYLGFRAVRDSVLNVANNKTKF